MRKLLAATVMAAACVPTLAQDSVTVEALLGQGYDVVGVFPSNAGPGLFLASDEGDRLVMCIVAETPDSAEVVTQYCKPVR